jgi:hypothetical protein
MQRFLFRSHMQKKKPGAVKTVAAAPPHLAHPVNPCINRRLGAASTHQTISPPFTPSILFAFSAFPGVCARAFASFSFWRKAQRSPSSSSSSRGKVMESGFCNGALASSSSSVLFCPVLERSMLCSAGTIPAGWPGL